MLNAGEINEIEFTIQEQTDECKTKIVTKHTLYIYGSIVQCKNILQQDYLTYRELYEQCLNLCHELKNKIRTANVELKSKEE